ncbi:hypothetical protein SAY87_030227 [Trapa incisa]|uniref:Uncharacterized protein n=1 Tax=Trapa incisa TaxID=236973 RepID=A0AAN7KN39_9MYRT|nr:hypothetical protein SAY87_030227 [Trapa incisa]
MEASNSVLDLFEIISTPGSTAGVLPVEIISELREESRLVAPARLDRMLCFLTSHVLLKCSWGGRQRRENLRPHPHLRILGSQGKGDATCSHTRLLLQSS